MRYLKLYGFKTIMVFMLQAFFISSVQAAENVIGWLENVSLHNHGIVFEAKIDTGADVTSINADIIEKYQKNGKDWLKFEIENKQGAKLVLEKEVVRYAKIKRKQADSIRRPVVMMNICIQKTSRLVEVNLSQRKHFRYKMLIGRNYLREHFLVDSGRKFTSAPDCP